MGTEDISSTSDLNQFGFHQLVEALADLSAVELDNLENTLIEESIFQFFSNPKLSFPVNDVEKLSILEEEDGRKFQFLVNFLGLQGASGPLPGTILDDIAEESYENEAIQARYLDFFNHHLIGVFHQIWRKYKYYIKFKPDFSDSYSRDVLNLLGLSREFLHFSHLNWNKIFYYIGLIQSGIRSSSIIAEILQHYFNLDNICLEEHIRQLVEIGEEQKNQLGMKNILLGENFIAGNKIESHTNKFRININNLELDMFYQFLPNTPNYIHLQELIRFLLKDPLPYDISLSLHPNTKSTFVLGEENSSFLGWTTLINSSSSENCYLSNVIIDGGV
ncbi:type VI secretion system baseplate subunit TssG [Actinobacillus equuli]|uniref:type VI secretion system baseplate subunit TssG n=1 Tax=Actinobacillus equuli TaxID=718 RepID=UPI00244323BB|nr:type VI secretion system baseplate subunit TssG [Actinobacillus equuli]WGE43084.1 type VI secretion system baseplate subunit TssG [Actinobacillus equuli subsp. haemolyticus]WGE51675.1 type VI secretion system baseplate subunit TssG [Actinobacillus equuli subsp. haemolyticus]WGE53783.1 type VI secretion system baseplate subunit TssG [Actinobacillus equuli subsp. haemolyticus]WGE74220.1 type VI secretion system baseplate subunit TssG [Actinobacillus equuli subsp. haemolyticus]